MLNSTLSSLVFALLELIPLGAIVMSGCVPVEKANAAMIRMYFLSRLS